ncbi:MAG: elongation factor G [Alphaproteobacteria bacterium]|nr:elongation factor G [Alphaproteobacteria bacterium]
MAKSTFAPAEIRNIALVGHGLAGKTSIAEAMLFNGGANSRLGVAGTSTSILDFEPEEHKRGSSIGSSFAWVEHKGSKINIIDTPGDGNFIFDAFAALRGADAAVVVVSAPDGIEVQTEAVYHKAVELGLPRIIVINKMDRERADPEQVLVEIEETFGAKPVPLQLPIGKEEAFEGVVSLFQKKAIRYKKDGSGAFEKGDVPDDLADAVESALENLVETVASADEELLEKYLETFELSDEEVRQGFHDALKRGEILPVLYTAASANVAVEALMDLVTWAVPSPLERGAIEALDGDGEPTELAVTSDGPFHAQVIKTFIDEFSGKMSILRLFAGSPPDDGQVENTVNSEGERLGTLYALRGNHRDPVDAPAAGDILAVAKLKNTSTNDTLAAPGSTLKIVGVQYPPPMMEYTIQPRSRSDEGKLKVALERLTDEDPSLTIGYDELSNKMVLKGMGMAHLDLSVDKMARKFKVNVETDLPAVPYRETIRRKVAHVEGKHKKQTGGAGQFGVCYVDIEPMDRGGGFEFADEIFGGSIPRQFIPSVEKGILERMKRGHVAGYPIVDIRVALKDGKYHPVDSKDVAFQLAGSKALQAAMDKAGVKLLEPVYSMEIVVPTENMGDIMGDITSRRGRVMGMDTKGKKTIIKASAPLAEIQRYAPDLRSMTGGKGTFTMTFESYEEVPSNLVDRIVAASPFRRDADED